MESETKKRASKLEFERRVFTVQGWIIDGVPDFLVLKQIKNQWDVDTRQAHRYLREAYNRWKSDEDISVEIRRQLRIQEIKQDIRNVEEKHKKTPQGLKAILDAKKELSKLEDLYPAKRIMLSQDKESPFIPTNIMPQITLVIQKDEATTD